mmetsp:Transcript_14238/g.21522  ORF Transcript_14238/g.21522 Transcript_14238/m.21522 type:complete len:374 (-) Transcript_14238:2-1123(-)
MNEELNTNIPVDIDDEVSLETPMSMDSEEEIGDVYTPPRLPSKYELLLQKYSTIVILVIAAASAVLLLAILALHAFIGLFQRPNQLAFVVFGDYGREGAFGQAKTAEAMERFCSVNQCDFAITTGDNIYNSGVESADSPLFKKNFEDIYLKGSMADMNYYHVLGNHDWHLDPRAEIEYAKRENTKWYMPSFYYNKTFDKGSFKVQFIFTDSTPYAYNVHPRPNADVLATQSSDEQTKFIETTLKNTDADYTFLVGHYPLYSAASHGNAYDIVKQIEPLMHRYNVKGYIGGHDHNMQYLKRGNISHFVSGAGSKIRDDLQSDHPNLVFSKATNGFLYVVLGENGEWMFKFYNSDLNLLYGESEDQKKEWHEILP